MGSKVTINCEQLLLPIPGEKPCGIDLREQDTNSYESIYWKLRTARHDSGDIERRLADNDPKVDPKGLLWGEIVSQATEVLATTSKDLEVAAWLCDALVREEGFAGLRDGLRLSRGLVEKYWDPLYPKLDPEGDGERTRVNQFGGLLKGGRHPALRIPLTGEKEKGEERFTELDYEKALLLEKVADPKEKQARIANNELTIQKFSDAIQRTPEPILKALVEDIKECIVEGGKFIDVLKAKCKQNGAVPSNLEFNKVLERVLEVLKIVAGPRIFSELPPVKPVDNSVAASAPPKAADRPGELTRESAIAKMKELAEFFRRIEPHSPVSHHLEEAVRWGQMALPELLLELIPDEKTRKDVFTRIGIVVPGKK